MTGAEKYQTSSPKWYEYEWIHARRHADHVKEVKPLQGSTSFGLQKLGVRTLETRAEPPAKGE